VPAAGSLDPQLAGLLKSLEEIVRIAVEAQDHRGRLGHVASSVRGGTDNAGEMEEDDNDHEGSDCDDDGRPHVTSRFSVATAPATSARAA
jgi:hypothetical protein